MSLIRDINYFLKSTNGLEIDKWSQTFQCHSFSDLKSNMLLTSYKRASLVVRMVKNPPALWTWVRSLGREDTLEKVMATSTLPSSILAWRIPWTEEPGVLQSTGLERVRHDWETNIHTYPIKSWIFGRILGITM